MRIRLSDFPRTLTLATTFALAMCSPLLAGSSKEVAAPDLMEAEEAWLTGSLGVAWDSKYVTEGRDNLEEGGLVSTALDVSAFGFTANAWLADGYDVDYTELNLGLAYGLEFGGFEAYVGYTYLHFWSEEPDADDHEIGAGIAYTELGWLVPAVDYVYGYESGGSFVELSVASEIPLIEDVWNLVPAVILGLDFGYASNEHDGANHVQLQLATEYALTETVTLGGYVAQSLALDDVDRDGGEDLFFGGVSVTVSF